MKDPMFVPWVLVKYSGGQPSKSFGWCGWRDMPCTAVLTTRQGIGKSWRMGKVILVTGASSGIGRACADLLQERGWTVIGASRRVVNDVAWRSIVMDVDDDASVAKGVADVVAEFARIDALIACAGWGLAGPAEESTMGDAHAQVETNFWGAVRAVTAVLPIMRVHGGGRIVLMSSIGGVIGIPYQAFYSASKFALEGYGESLAYEVAPFNVHVTMVEPGNFATGFTSSRRTVVSGPDSPYAAASEKAIKVMEDDEVNGARPDQIALLVEQILLAARPARRVSVGKFDERIGLVAKRLLPFRVFQKAARGSLGV